MPSKAEFRQNLEKVVNDNTGMDFLLIHGLLHEGDFAGAEQHAVNIGFNTPPGELPLFGWPLTPEQQVFLQETLDAHRPGNSGLPNHDY